jgi:hypothetical protein
VVRSYVPFKWRVGGKQLSALLVAGGTQLFSFLVGGWLYAVMCLSVMGLVVGSYVPFW